MKNVGQTGNEGTKAETTEKASEKMRSLLGWLAHNMAHTSNSESTSDYHGNSARMQVLDLLAMTHDVEELEFHANLKEEWRRKELAVRAQREIDRRALLDICDAAAAVDAELAALSEAFTSALQKPVSRRRARELVFSFDLTHGRMIDVLKALTALHAKQAERATGDRVAMSDLARAECGKEAA